MKKMLLAAAAASAMLATPAMAADNATFNFSGSVAEVCTVSGAAATVDFGALTDGSGNYTAGSTTQTATSTNAYCNQGQTKATISHTNFYTSNAATTGFTNNIPMTASLVTIVGAADNVTVADTTVASGTTSSAGTQGDVGNFTGLKVKATLGSIGSAKLVAGTYGGSITVTLQPQS